MNKKKIVILSLMLVAIIALSSALFVACNNDTPSDDKNNTTITETEGLLIKNGDFKVIDTKAKDYPRTIPNWTGGKMYSSGSYKDDVTAGAISLSKAVYDANKSKWNDSDDSLYNKLVAGGRYGDDDKIKNALMVYMPEESTNSDGKKVHGPTAYGYTSTSFTLAKGSYYRLKVDVLTHKIGGANETDRGARIYLSSNTYAEFAGIDTKGEWKTYEIIIESSPVSSTSLNVMLGLGKYNAYSQTGLTTGYAVFDNLSLEKIEDDDATEAIEGKVAYDDAVAKELVGDKFVATTTLKVPNGRFDFGTTSTSSSSTPNNWSLVNGNSGQSDKAPTSLGWNAIVNTANWADIYSKLSSTFYTQTGADSPKEKYVPAEDLQNINIADYSGRVGSNVYMLSQQLMTAQGIKSARTITIEKNKTYALSIDLYTYGVHGAGVSLVLSGSDGEDIVIKGISSAKSSDVLIGSTAIDPNDNGYTTGTVEGATTNGWTTYTFYIKGNQFRNYSYNMTVWLGTEGTNSNTAKAYHSFTNNSKQTTYTADGTFSNGWVFIDELQLNEIDELPSANSEIYKDGKQTLDVSEKGDSYKAIAIDLTSANMFGEGSGYILNDTTSQSSNANVESIGKGIPSGWTSGYDTSDTSNAIVKNIVSEGVVNIQDEASFNGLGTYPKLPYDIQEKVAYQINAKSDSYYEIESKPFTVKKDTAYRISVWVKTVDVKSTSGAYVYLLNKDDDDAVLATYSKVNTEDYDEYQNDWCELTLVVRGKDEDVNVSLKFTLGTGNRWAASTLAKGSMFVANINGSTIANSVFEGTSTGTYVKSVDLTTSDTYTFKNGGFDSYNRDDENIEENKALNEQSRAAAPTDWTFSNNKLNPNTDGSKLAAGVIALNTTDNKTFSHSNQTSAVFPNIAPSVFDSFYGSITDPTTDLGSLPGEKAQILAIGSTDGTTKYAAGYSSSSVTLSANSFYSLSVYVRTVGNTKATVYLTGESSLSSGENTFTIENSGSDWTKYTFFIRTGQSSVSVKLNLWLGQNTDYVNIAGASADEQAENAKSAGAVFFDNVVYKTIDEAVFDKAVADETNKVLSFLTDSFDSLSSTIESRSKLTSPSGWSGAVGTNQSSSNTKSGVIYADEHFLDTKTIDGVEGDYVDILGADYKVDDIKITDEELAEAKKDSKYDGMSDDDILTALKEAKAIELKTKNWMPIGQINGQTHSGNQMLLINNTDKSAYTYTSSSFTLKESSFYEISLWVRSYALSDGEKEGVYVEMYLGSANETDKPFVFEAIASETWKEYKFYVQTLDDDVTSATVKLSLGKYIANEVNGETVVTGLTSGYAMFDDVKITKVTEEIYNNAKEQESTVDNVKTRKVSNETKGSGDDKKDDGKTNTPGKTFNTEALWWMVPTIVLGVLIIVVVIVWIVRKVRKPISKKKEKKAASVVETPSLDAKHNKYDDNKE